MTEITQADWDAGLDLLSRHFSPPDRPITINVVAEAFARHRLAERAKIVAWLRSRDQLEDCYSELQDDWLSNRIEAGEHETFTRSSDT